MKGRVPVLVGITDTSFVESANVARKSAEAGADALVLAPPYYFPAGQPELEYLKHLTPELCCRCFSTICRIAEAGVRSGRSGPPADIPGIVGIKLREHAVPLPDPVHRG